MAIQALNRYTILDLDCVSKIIEISSSPDTSYRLSSFSPFPGLSLLQFVCFVSTIIQKHAYQFLLYLTDLFGDQNYKAMMTMWFVIFSNFVGQLVWIMQDHFQLIRLAMDFPSTVDSYLSISQLNSNVGLSLAPLLVILFHA